MNVKNLLAIGCMALMYVSLHAAVPQLKGSPETAGDMGLKVKVPTGSQMVQALTPKSQRWGFRRGDKKWTETHYNVRDFWLDHERGAEWTDRKGYQHFEVPNEKIAEWYPENVE